MRGPRRRSTWKSTGADPADVVADQELSSTSSDSLGIAMRSLDARSRDILESRWLTDQKSTLHELAARYDVSAERIRQLEKNAMKKLKNAMQETRRRGLISRRSKSVKVAQTPFSG